MPEEIPPNSTIVNKMTNPGAPAGSNTTIGQTMGSLIFFKAFSLLGSVVNNMIAELGTFGTQLANQLSQTTQNANLAQQHFYDTEITPNLNRMNAASSSNEINKESAALNAKQSLLSAMSSAWQVPQKGMQTVLEPVQQAPSTISQILATMATNAGAVIGLINFLSGLRING